MNYQQSILNYQHFKQQILAGIHKQTPVKMLFGAELEFYLPEANYENSITNELDESCTLTKEQGNNQYEIQFRARNDPLALCEDIERIKSLLTTKYSADFRAKPFAGDYGSSLHIHCSFYDDNGKNLMSKVGDEESLFTLHIIGGLCSIMHESMVIFAPNEDSYLRFSSNIHDNPTNVSWGGNNRTTAIRIPPSIGLAAEDHNRRIEHRVAGADADPFLVIAAILVGIHYGIQNSVTPPERIYGIASDSKYNLPFLPKSLSDAITLFNNGKILRYALGRVVMKI
jgi:glutamine synthetase